jgi:hypothetical protein
VAIEELYARVLAGDDEAVRMVSDWLLRNLRRSVLATLPEANGHVIESSIDDTVLTYLARPQRY